MEQPKPNEELATTIEQSEDELLLASLERELAEIANEEASVDGLIVTQKEKIAQIIIWEKEEENKIIQKDKEEKAERAVQKVNKREEKLHKKRESAKAKEPKEKVAKKKKTAKKSKSLTEKAGQVIAHPATKPLVATTILAAGLAMTARNVNESKPTVAKPLKTEEVTEIPAVKKEPRKAEPFEKTLTKKLVEQAVEKIDTNLYKELSYDGKITYLYRLFDSVERKEHPGPYLMEEKETGTMYIIGEDGKLLAKSDTTTIGITPGNLPNKVNEDFSNKATEGRTPAGLFSLTRKNADEKAVAGGSWRIDMKDQDNGVYLHPFLPDQKGYELMQSAGCIRVSKEFLDTINTYIKEGSRIKINAVPDPDGSTVWIDPDTYEMKHVGDKSKYVTYLTKIKKYANI